MDQLNQASSNSVQSAPASNKVPNDGTGMANIDHTL